MIPLTLDPSRSEVMIYTSTRGVFSQLAHDLALMAVPDPCVRTESSAVLRFRVDRIRVMGVVRKGAIVPDVLSAKDRGEIERRVATEIFAGCDAVRVELRVEASRLCVGVCVASRRVDLSVGFTVTDEVSAHTVRGECVLSLKALGLKPVRAPLGAFQVADELRVNFTAVWV